jgi:hypothetical protein
MKVLIIKVLAESHAYSYFANSLCRAFEELGHEAAVSDQFAHALNDTVDLSQLVGELQATRYDVVVSFNSFLGSVSASNGDSLFDLLDVKFLGWQFDHPIYAPTATRPVFDFSEPKPPEVRRGDQRARPCQDHAARRRTAR